MDKFSEWWEHVPRKVGKIACRKSYQRQIKIIVRERPQVDPHEFLLESIQTYARSKKVADGYVTNPLTWLNQGRYYDEPESAPVAKPKTSFMDEVTRAEMARAREIREMQRKRRTPVIMNFDLTKAFDEGWQPPAPWYFPVADPLRPKGFDDGESSFDTQEAGIDRV